MKIVHPVAHDLGILKLRLEEVECDLRSYKEKLTLLMQRNTRLKGRVSEQPKISQLPSRLRSPTSFSSTSDTYISSNLSSTTQVSNLSSLKSRARPTYAASTKASRAKHRVNDCPIGTQCSDQNVVIQPGFNNGQGWVSVPKTPGWTSSYYTYRDGSLVERTGNFLLPTKATQRKQKRAVVRSLRRIPSYEESDKLRRREERLSLLDNPLCKQLPNTMSDQAIQDLATFRSLPIKTRLDDDTWLSSCKQVCIDCNTQYSVLQRGHDIAKQCLWDFLNIHKPSICAYTFPEGWATVRFGRDELMSTFGDERRPSRDRENFGFRHNSPERTRGLVFDMTGLRNTVCHFSRCDLVSVDNYLKTVQELACQLYDEKRAFAVRDLRDEMRKAVEDIIQDILALEPLCLLPFMIYPWKEHHEMMFEGHLHYKGKFAYRQTFPPGESGLPKSIMRVAAAWIPRTIGVEAFDWGKRLLDTEGVDSSQNDTEGDQVLDRAVKSRGLQARPVERRHSICAWRRQSNAPHSVCDRGRERRVSIPS